MVYYRFY